MYVVWFFKFNLIFPIFHSKSFSHALELLNPNPHILPVVASAGEVKFFLISQHATRYAFPIDDGYGSQEVK